MLRKIIFSAGESAALVLTQEYLEKAGIEIGAEIDLSVKRRSLNLRPVTDAEWAQTLDSAQKLVFKRCQSAQVQLAKELDLVEQIFNQWIVF